MCGIVGYISKKNIKNQLLQCLKKLEYRGYDSSGIAVLNDNGEITTEKEIGSISCLENKLKDKIIKGDVGLAHTRWATHGKVTVANAHPHCSQTGEFSIVHNGIIENYLELKKHLNYNFNTETDTEVAAFMLEDEKCEDTLQKIINVCDKIVGSFAFVAMRKTEPDTIYLAKRSSPLYIACDDDKVLACSDPICFDSMFENYYTLYDGEYCKGTLNGVTFYNANGEVIQKEPHALGIFEKTATLDGFDYFADKEIHEIPQVLERVLEAYCQTNYLKKIDSDFFKNINRIKIIGCGTAYHAGLMGASYIQKKTGIEATAHIASEFRYNNPILNNNTLCIFTSQSGETADTLFALNLAKENHCKTIALVNVPYSAIARQAHITLPLCAHAEIAVISTKAYNAMLFVFYILSLHLQNLQTDGNNNLFEPLSELTKYDFFPNEKQFNILLEMAKGAEKMFFIGKGDDYITAQEASLKYKEITYVNSVCIASGELKHGTLALIDQNTVVVLFATNQDMLLKNLSSASEIKARGGKIVLVTQLDLTQENLKCVDHVLELPKVPEDVVSMISVIPMQLLAYKMCVYKDHNPDKPRNLAKSVTVE